MRREPIHINLLRNQHIPFFFPSKKNSGMKSDSHARSKNSPELVLNFNWLARQRSGWSDSLFQFNGLGFILCVCVSLNKERAYSKTIISRTCQRSSLSHSFLFSFLFLKWFSPSVFLLSLLQGMTLKAGSPAHTELPKPGLLLRN